MGPLYRAEFPQRDRASGLGSGIRDEDSPLSACGRVLISVQALAGLRTAVMAEMAHGQGLVGIVNRVLPLTGRAGGVPRPNRGHLIDHIDLWNRNVPASRAGITS